MIISFIVSASSISAFSIYNILRVCAAGKSTYGTRDFIMMLLETFAHNQPFQWRGHAVVRRLLLAAGAARRVRRLWRRQVSASPGKSD
jgi:hypothetical protein